MIDLHAHTRISDGTDSPAELVEKARARGISVLGITDHDTVAGWDEAAGAAGRVGIALVRGMELTTHASNGASVHLLGYLFNPDAPEIQTHIAAMADSRANRARRMVEGLAADLPITWEQVASRAEGAIGRPHIADALIAAGVVKNREEAFASYLHPSKPYYVPHYSPRVQDAVQWVNRAGGKAVVAHPLAASRGKTMPLAELAELSELGLFGVEVNHRDNPAAQRGKLAELARAHGLFQFGSSDYHGSGKPNQLGEFTTDRSTLQALAQGAFLEVINL